MKTIRELFRHYATQLCPDFKTEAMDSGGFAEAIKERDKEWKQKIQKAKDETSNWNCKEVLTKLLEDK